MHTATVLQTDLVFLNKYDDALCFLNMMTHFGSDSVSHPSQAQPQGEPEPVPSLPEGRDQRGTVL